MEIQAMTRNKKPALQLPTAQSPVLPRTALTFDALVRIPAGRRPLETYVNTSEPSQDILFGLSKDRNMVARMAEWDRRWKDIGEKKEK